jgi:hypothetical protein
MVWLFTSTRHEQSIGSFARRWIAGSMLDRWLIVTAPGVFWFMFWFYLAIGATVASGDDGGFVLILIGMLPWGLWVLDAVVDHFHVNADMERLKASDDVILATRCEYVGGHPLLPHGRFCYLLLSGTREDPVLTVVFPAPPDGIQDSFVIPVLDLKKTKPEKGASESTAAELAGSVNQSLGKFLTNEKLTLLVDYDGHSGRKHKVEFTNFFHGNNEIRNWRNYLVCAQAEADTGVKPYGPWKSLKPGFPVIEEVTSGAARNGHEESSKRSAFPRR